MNKFILLGCITLLSLQVQSSDKQNQSNTIQSNPIQSNPTIAELHFLRYEEGISTVTNFRPRIEADKQYGACLKLNECCREYFDNRDIAISAANVYIQLIYHAENLKNTSPNENHKS